MSNISDLRFDDKNMNAHTAKGMGLLEKSLQQFGAGRSILIDKNNRIIGGNGVVEAAGNIGLEDVQIVESDGKKIIAVKRTDIDLDSKKGRELAMADNAVAAEDLSWDKGNIDEVSEQFGIDPGDWISDWDSQAEQEIEEDEAPEVDESEPAKSELGKVYKLGNHRLMCGDSTDAGSVAILMDGQKADMVFTDPPYRMEAQGGSSQWVGRQAAKLGESIKDLCDFDPKKLLELLENMFSNKINAYIFCNKDLVPDYLNWALKNKFAFNILFWKKPNALPLGGQHRPDVEYLLYFRKNATWNDGKEGVTYSKCLEFGRDHSTPHPTMKPIELICNELKISSNNGDNVLDLFGGSGSTLIACEQLGRKCYMMELDPKYCDVIRKRWWKFTHDGNEEGWEEGTLAI